MTEYTLNINIEHNVLEKSYLKEKEIKDTILLYFTGYLETTDEWIPIYNCDEGYLILTKKVTIGTTLHIKVYDVLKTSGVRMKHGLLIL